MPCKPCPYRYTFVKQHKSNSRLLEPTWSRTPQLGARASARPRPGSSCRATVAAAVLRRRAQEEPRRALEVNAPETVLSEQDDGLDDDGARRHHCKSTLEHPAPGIANGVLYVSDFSRVRIRPP